MNDYYQKIAAFLKSSNLDAFPSSAVLEAKRSILDTIGCMIAGMDTPLGHGVRKLAERFKDQNGTRVLGMTSPAVPFAAAMANSYMANAHDADDGHRRSRLHAGGIIIPAALAAAQENNSSGREFLEAIIVGFELGYRAGMVTTGWDAYHGSAMGSTFGAAAAAGRLMVLPPDEIINAMGIAEMQAPNCMLMGWVKARNAPMIKEGMGWSAASGLMSAYMAQSGIRGTLTIFNGADDLSDIDTLGKAFEVERHYFKPHPGCRWSQVPLQTLQALMADHDIAVGNIREVTVQANSHAAYLDNPRPSTMDNAQYSIPFVMAAALVDGAFGPEQMQPDKLADPDILDMARRIHIVPEPAFDKGYPATLKARVQVALNTGTTVSAMGGRIRGDDNFPLSDAEIKEKFVWMSSNRLDPDQARAVMDAVWTLETHADMAGIMEMLFVLCGD